VVANIEVSDDVNQPLGLTPLSRTRTSLVFRIFRDVIRDQAGAALVEFTVIGPVLLVLWLGVIQFGFILNNSVALSAATAAGVRTLSVDRGQSSTPYTDTLNQINASAGTLTVANITTTVTICSSSTSCSACSTDSTCLTALSNGQGYAATVSTSYPCVFSFTLLNLGSCKLAATETSRVQ